MVIRGLWPTTVPAPRSVGTPPPCEPRRARLRRRRPRRRRSRRRQREGCSVQCWLVSAPPSPTAGSGRFRGGAHDLACPCRLTGAQMARLGHARRELCPEVARWVGIRRATIERKASRASQKRGYGTSNGPKSTGHVAPSAGVTPSSRYRETTSSVHCEGISTEVWPHPSTVSRAESGIKSSTTTAFS